METVQTISLIFGGFGVLGLIYAIYTNIRNRRAKLLLYETTSIIPLATAYSPDERYKLSVVYQSKGSPEELISSVHTRFLRFANFGKEPIRKSDIASANPVKVIIEGVRTLDIALERTTRTASNISIKELNLSKNVSSALISFDYLDYRDGGLIKILTEGNQGTVYLKGDIIGMPMGIRDKDAKRPGKLLNALFVFLGLSLFIASQFFSAYIFYIRIGTWQNVWLLWIPLGFLMAFSIFAVLIISITIGFQPTFHKELHLPKWYESMQLMRRYPSTKNETDIQFETKESE